MDKTIIKLCSEQILPEKKPVSQSEKLYGFNWLFNSYLLELTDTTKAVNWWVFMLTNRESNIYIFYIVVLHLFKMGKNYLPLVYVSD